MSFIHDDAVVGAGILGLAHAYQLARRGRKVVVFERSKRAEGASVRNFGMIWPIGQPAGSLRDLALKSRDHWLDLLSASNLWRDEVGSLHLAYREDEAQVLREFQERSGFELLEPAEILERVPLVNPNGLLLGLFSPWEICVDPREAIGKLPSFLSSSLGVRFEFEQTVVGFDDSTVLTTKGRFPAARLWVCSGDDFQTLYPEAFARLGLHQCKLQMMRGVLPNRTERIGPMLAAGLTLRHYRSFEGCPTLPALRDRFAREMPEFDRYGIHVMTSQNGRGEVVIGDSHEYGDDVTPFDKIEVDAMILDYLKTFLNADPTITARWHGTYAKLPGEAFKVIEPAPQVKAICAAGGAGMTLSHGIADQIVTETVGL